MQNKVSNFTNQLITWNKHINHRLMPWKNIKNPYHIWLAEIIMQQTRVAQGTAYYEKFIKTYPTIQDLAKAPINDVLLHWEGLGYYSRARNLHATARYISEERNGVFPNTYKDLLQLKGVGPYTAAAIASFAYNLPHAVVDGNVYRVLARYFGEKTAIDSSAGKKLFQALADEHLPPNLPGEYNQAIMDFGAMICSPKSPDCNTCPLNNKCYAFAHHLQKKLPYKSKKLIIKKRYLNFLIIEDGEDVLIEQRTEKDIWQLLHQFPMVETDKSISQQELIEEHFPSYFTNKTFKIINYSNGHSQQLTHQKIIASFLHVHVPLSNTHYKRIKLEKLRNFAFPRIINLYLEQNSVLLNKHQ